MKKALVVFAAVVFLAAGKVPTVRVDRQDLIIGDTKINLPYTMWPYQDKKTGEITIRMVMGGNCDPKTEKMIGFSNMGTPLCVPEGAGTSK